MKKATSYKKYYQVFSSIGLDNIDKYQKDGPFSNGMGIVNLHTSKGTHWVAFINENFFDSNGCAPPQKQSNLIIKRNGYCLYSEEKIQGLTNKKDSYCAIYC